MQTISVDYSHTNDMQLTFSFQMVWKYYKAIYALSSQPRKFYYVTVQCSHV